MSQLMEEKERSRLWALATHERRLFQQGFIRIAGIDEAGRGPLAGPVIAAACILPQHIYFPFLNDSKQLSPEIRDQLYVAITSHSETQFGIGASGVEVIDRLNILQATFLAMQQAVSALPSPPEYLLIDGSQTPSFSIPFLPLVKGDMQSISIAAASVLAKVTRDRMMLEFHHQWPMYGFHKHKGYATEGHLKALFQWGPCPIHRKSFEPVKSMKDKESFPIRRVDKVETLFLK